MRRFSRSFAVYIRAISVVGAGIFLVSLYFLLQDRVFVWEWLFFLAVIFLTELFPTKLPDVNIELTVTVPVVLGMFLSHHSAATIVISTIPILIAPFITQWGTPFRWLAPLVLYNDMNHVIAVAVASLVYVVAGGPFLTPALSSTGPTLELVLYLLLWAGIYSITTALLCATGTSLGENEPWRVSAQRNLRWSFPDLFVSVPFATLFVSLYMGYELWGILLLIVPFFVARQALNLHVSYVNTYRETITALGAYIQHHHLYTKGHLERVADLSQKIARQMQLPVQSLMYIKDAGLLHDIGKVGVDEEILDKTEKLSPEDWAMIRAHPARGAEILTEMQYLECIVPWVRGHHERPDGKGYPDALADRQIPIEAAVIAAADAFDAMTGEMRLYNIHNDNRKTIDEGIDELRYGAGTQFDPRVVKAFLTIMAAEQEKDDG